MNYILFDGPVRDNLLPFTFTRPVADIRVGILTIREKWERYLESTTSTITQEYLSEKFPLTAMDENVLINASYLPNGHLVEMIKGLRQNQAIFYGDDLIALYTEDIPKLTEKSDWSSFDRIDWQEDIVQIVNTWDIFEKNGEALQADFDHITAGRKSAPISDTNRVIHPENIFLEEGAQVEYSILNATEGPIYLAKNSQIWEGAMVRGAFSLGEHSVVKMGGKIYGATSLGPHCKIAGEVSNAVIFGYSSKGHEGYLGNAVLGEWCNIGADSNNSNLKNNYAKVRLWNYATESFEQTGLQFCGLMMGDHSKTAINTMLNTGTVVGVNVNIYVPGFPRNFIPSFSWGGASGFSTYLPEKAFEAAKVMMARRQVEFDEQEARILKHVFELTKKWRKY
ncbi:MAG: GlmU family protein [Pricia sp.]